MKKFLLVSLGVLSLFISKEAMSQSDIFAGGEIYVEYAGDYTEACGDQIPMHFIYRFYRDEVSTFGIPFPTLPPANIVEGFNLLMIEKPDPDDRTTWTPSVVTVDDEVYVNPNVPNLCVRNAFATTEGKWYRTSTPVMVNANSTFLISTGLLVPGDPNLNQVGRNFHSPENDNLVDGQTYYIETVFNTFCDADTTGPMDFPANKIVTWSNGWNETVDYKSNDIVESFCSGTAYSMDLDDLISPNFSVFSFLDTVTGVRTFDTIFDSYSFSIKRPFNRERAAVTNAPGFSTFAPFPTSLGDRFRIDQENLLTFTPELALGQRGFTSAIIFETVERRETIEKKARTDGTFELVRVESAGNLVSVSQRQLRFVIGAASNCNRRLPNFSSVAPFDPVTEEYLFDCTDNEFDVIMSEPMLIGTLEPGDFRVFRGTQFNPTDDNAWVPNEVIVDPANINQFGEFTEMTIVLNEGLGPGNYTLFTKFASSQGDGSVSDLLLLRNRCGFELGNDSTIYKFRVRGGSVPFYDFSNSDDLIRFCFPADEPIELDPVAEGLINSVRIPNVARSTRDRVDSSFFQYRGPFSPSAPVEFDTNFVGTPPKNLDLGYLYTVPDNYDFLTNPLQDKPEGFWIVGIGLDYGWTHNGQRFEARCFDSDTINIEILEHPEVRTRDFDLCVGEDWPIIRDLVDTTSVDPQFRPINYTWGLFRQDKGDDEGQFVPIGSQSNDGTLNDTLDASSFAFGVDTAFLINSVVTFPNGCKDSNVVTLQRTAVRASLGEDIGDTIICLGEEFLLENVLANSYLIPDSIDHEWFINDQLIPEADSSSFMIRRGESGEYKLVVVKNTDQGFCTDTVAINVRIADSLAAPVPVCSKVTFQDGAIEQLFFWPVVDGAEKYQVRGVAQDGRFINNAGQEVGDNEWEDANDLFGIHNRIIGAELNLQVRAVNLEVPEDAPCRFGPVSIAEPCEVVVKEVNIFTPNGDGINDLLRFDLLEVYPGSSLVIFNRWGRKIYESNDYKNDWDGDDHKEGVYYYVLNIDDPNNVQDIFKGTFTLLR